MLDVVFVGGVFFGLVWVGDGVVEFGEEFIVGSWGDKGSGVIC